MKKIIASILLMISIFFIGSRNLVALDSLPQLHQIYSIGDSLTNYQWESKITTLLDKNSWGYVNKGVSGEGTTFIQSRFNGDVIQNHDAEYVTIWGGIDDLMFDIPTSTTKTNLQAVYTAAHNAGIKVIALNLTPFKNYSTWNTTRQAMLEDINNWIANTATNIDYKVDLWSAMVDPNVPLTTLPAYTSDWLHFNATGNNAIGTAIYNSVTWTKGTAGTINKAAIKSMVLPEGTMINGKLWRRADSGLLQVQVLTSDGQTPSVDNPVYISVRDERTQGVYMREITSQLIVQVPSNSTNWFASAGNEIDLFVYAGYNNTDGVALAISRSPNAIYWNDFSTASNNDHYAAISSSPNFNQYNVFQIIGRVNAKLSSSNVWGYGLKDIVINKPVFATRWLSWTPTLSANGSMTYTNTTINAARYKIDRDSVYVNIDILGTIGGTVTNEVYATLPYTKSVNLSNGLPVGSAQLVNSFSESGTIRIVNQMIGFQRNTLSNTYVLGSEDCRGTITYEID